MRKRLALDLFAALALVVGGAFLSKYVDASAGGLLSASGGALIGRLFQQPRYLRDGGAVPDKELP
jgi:hypothetical protein